MEDEKSVNEKLELLLKKMDDVDYRIRNIPDHGGVISFIVFLAIITIAVVFWTGNIRDRKDKELEQKIELVLERQKKGFEQIKEQINGINSELKNLEKDIKSIDRAVSSMRCEQIKKAPENRKLSDGDKELLCLLDGVVVTK